MGFNKLTDHDIVGIFNEYHNNEPIHIIAKRHNVSRQTINSITRNRCKRASRDAGLYFDRLKRRAAKLRARANRAMRKKSSE